MPFLSFFLRDIFLLWIIIEISNFLFIFRIIKNIKKNFIIFLYFFTQIIASFIIIYIIQFIHFPTQNHLIVLITVALFTKLRAPPFHRWIIWITKYLSLDILFFITSIQKIIPFNLLIQLNFISPSLLYLSTLLCILLPPIIILNISNLKLLFTYSSINQTGWLLLITFIKDILWFKYFYFYTLTLISAIILIEQQKIFIDISYKKPKNKDNRLILLIIINLGGLPPFAFFYFKWIRVSYFTLNTPLSILSIFLLFRSLIIFYIYSSIIIKRALIKLNSKTIKSLKITPPLLLIIFLIIIIITLIILIWK